MKANSNKNFQGNEQTIDEIKSSENVITKSKNKLRVFYHPLNSLLGHAFVELNSKNQKDPFMIVGTCDHNDDSLPPNQVAKIFDSSINAKDLINVLSDCDIIIFESLKTDEELLEKVITYFEYTAFADKRTFLLVSHPLIWYETRTLKNSFFDSSETLAYIPPTKQDNNFSAKAKLPIVIEPSKITDNDFFERRTLPCYDLHRLLENRIYALSENNPSVSGLIVLPGILFGNGEDDFYPIFENFMLPSPSPIVCYGKGDNFIPVVHCNELAEKLLNLILCPQPLKTFCIYSNKEKITQNKLLQEFCKISKQGQPQEVTSFDYLLHSNYELMTLNLQLQTSNVFVNTHLNGNKTQSLEAININKVEDQIAHPLLIDNFDQILKEFISYRGIRIYRIILLCPALLLNDGELLSQLSTRLEIDVIKMEDLIKAIIDQTDGESSFQSMELKAEIQEAIEKEKEAQYLKLMEEYNQAKKSKKKNILEPSKDDIKIDIFNALQDQAYFKILFNKLQSVEYKKRGFILVNPTSNANNINKLVQAIEAECLFDNIQTIFFNFDSEKVSSRIIELEQQLKSNPKSETLLKEAEQWKKIYEDYGKYPNENLPSANSSISTIMFSDPKINIEIVINDYLNKGSRVNNNFNPHQSANISKLPTIKSTTLSHPAESENQKQEKISSDKQTVDARRSSKNLAESNLPKNKDESAEANEEEAILNLKSASIKQYLADNVLPDLTEGIVQICKEKPENPVKFLIDFLKKKSA